MNFIQYNKTPLFNKNIIYNITEKQKFSFILRKNIIKKNTNTRQ